MAVLVGTDEAGYGPNLGPLVISATAWNLPDEQLPSDLYELLSDAVCREPRDGRVAIADSKLLYKPGGGVGLLEQGVLSAALAQGHRLPTWRDGWRVLAPSSLPELERLPWYEAFQRPLPADADPLAICRLAQGLSDAFRRSGVTLRQIQAVAVFPDRFNRLVEHHGTKGGALTEETLKLVSQLLADVDEPHVLIQCDKHGGRNRYAPMLQQHFPDHLVEVVRESRPVSTYRWGPAGRRVECRFIAKAESFLPAALASMTSKLLRELAMAAFNAFWQKHVPDIKPTAGYPVDARRFKQQIGAVQHELGIADQLLWRIR